MYGVIYWTTNPDAIQIVKNEDGSVWVAQQLTEADEKATYLESELGIEDVRTISLEGVSE